MPDASPPTVLVTGFEPFGGETVNPSALIAQALHGQVLAGVQVHTAVLPCVFGAALDALDAALSDTRPALVLALGQAAGRMAFTPERVAINVDDARMADNAGAQPIDRPVVPGGPAAYFSTLPIKAMVAAMREAGLPAEVSQTAGTFVCNHVFYQLMHRLNTHAALRGVRGGFMHVPLLPEQAVGLFAGRPGLALEAQVQAVGLAVQAAWQHQCDLVLPGGAEH
jgi:pyroglutamyl-peptidase